MFFEMIFSMFMWPQCLPAYKIEHCSLFIAAQKMINISDVRAMIMTREYKEMRHA